MTLPGLSLFSLIPGFFFLSSVIFLFKFLLPVVLAPDYSQLLGSDPLQNEG